MFFLVDRQNFKRAAFLASFNLSFLSLRLGYILEVECPSKACVLKGWSPVTGTVECFREWGLAGGSGTLGMCL